MMKESKQSPIAKPVSLRILHYFIYLQMALSGFVIIISLLFMWIPGESGSGWSTFKDNVLSAAFGISPQEYDILHLTYLSGISVLTLIVLMFFELGIRKRIFLLCLILTIALIVLNLGNPLALVLAFIMILLLTVSPKARKYLNFHQVEKTGTKE